MSVTKRTGGWQVKYRDETGRQKSAGVFARKSDAVAVDGEIKRRRRLGPTLTGALVDRPQTLTLAEFVETGFSTHSAKLSQRTRDQYCWALNLHLQELLTEPLHALDVPRLDRHQTYLLEHGRSVNTTRTALTMLSGVLQVAVDHGLLPANPARSLRKVDADPKADVIPLAPRALEALIASLTGRARIIAVLGGHLGLSPVEIRLADWDQIKDDRLTIPAAKTKRQRARTRVIKVPAVTMAELRAWRLQSGGRSGPIVGEMTAGALKAWAHRNLHPRGVTVYQLRHSHASALHYCGWTVPAAARRLGHSSAVHMRHYAHVIDQLEDRSRFADLDALITWARSDDQAQEAAR